MPLSASSTGHARQALSILLEAAALLLALVALAGVGQSLGHGNGLLLKALGGGVGAVAGLLAGYCHQLARQIVTLPADVALEQDKRQPVFYLRSFHDDVIMSRVGETDVPMLPAFASEQEQLERALRRIGPVVGVAVTPKEQLPLVGFSPLHLTDDEWRERVRDLMQKSALVVLRIARTEGVLWEFQEAPKVVSPERLLFLVPSQADYEAFLELTRNLLPFALPPYRKTRRPPKSTVTAIVYFKPGWQAFLIPLQIPKWRSETLTAALIQAMQPVYEQIKVPWRRGAPVALETASGRIWTSDGWRRRLRHHQLVVDRIGQPKPRLVFRIRRGPCSNRREPGRGSAGALLLQISLAPELLNWANARKTPEGASDEDQIVLAHHRHSRRRRRRARRYHRR